MAPSETLHIHSATERDFSEAFDAAAEDAAAAAGLHAAAAGGRWFFGRSYRRLLKPPNTLQPGCSVG